MAEVFYLLEPAEQTGTAALEAALRSPNEGLHRARLAWESGEWRAYQEGLAHRRERTLVFHVEVKTHDPAVVYLRDRVELELDKTLFTAMVMLYGTHGWDGMAAMLEALSGVDEHARRLVRATLVRVEEQIIPALVAIEREATALAVVETEERRTLVASQLQKFVVDKDSGEPRLRIAGLDTLLAKLKEARKHQAIIFSLEKGVAERRSKDGGDPRTVRSRRERDEYRRLLAEKYEGPQREQIRLLARVQEEIAGLYPPALLILDELEADLDDWLSLEQFAATRDIGRRRASIEAQHRYEGKILRALRGLDRQLADVAGTLSNPGMSTRLMRYLDRPPMQRWTQGGPHAEAIATCLQEWPGFRQFAKAHLMRGWLGDWEKYEERRDYFLVNRVLGRVGCLQRLLDRMSTAAMPGMRLAVLKQYLLDLERDIARRKADAAFEESIWHAIEVGLALAGLIMAAIALPLGPGAVGVPAALATLISITSMTLCVMSVVYMARSLARMIEESDAADSALMQVLVDLGQSNAQALVELGQLMSRQRTLSKSLGVGMIRTLAELAAASRLKPVAFALDMRGHLDDMEVLGASF